MMRATLCLGFLFITRLTAAPLLTAYHADRAPKLDGKLDDACWKQALTATPFVTNLDNTNPNEETRARIAWDKTNLYLAVEAFEGMLKPALNMAHKVPAKAAGTDVGVFSDDCLEFFLQPPGSPYYHLATNSGNGRYDAREKDAKWNSGWRCIARRDAGKYIVEAAVPFTALSGKPQGEWRLNIARHRPQNDEFSTWCGLRGAFHQPALFGYLQFAQSGPSAGAARLAIKETNAEISLKTGAKPLHLSGEIISGKKQERRESSGVGQLSLKLPFPGGTTSGQLSCFFRLSSGKKPLAESAPLSMSPGSTQAVVSFTQHQSTARLFLNGQEIKGDGEASFKLKLLDGMNHLAFLGTAQGDTPSLAPTVMAHNRTLPLRWRLVPPTVPDWQKIDPDKKWAFLETQEAEGQPAISWSAPGERECRAVAMLHVNTSTPPLFPKTNQFFVPRNSAQLLRTRIPQITQNGFKLILETPANLQCAAIETLGLGTKASLEDDGALKIGNQQMRRTKVAFSQIPGSGMSLSLCWRDENNHTLFYAPTLSSGGTHDWRRLSTTVTAPENAVAVFPLLIKWQNRGITGTFWVDNLSFRRSGSTENLAKLGSFDEPEWKRNFPNEGVNGTKCFKVVATPDQIKRQQACWIRQDDIYPRVVAGESYTVELDVKCDNVVSNTANPLIGLLLRDQHGKSGTEQPLYTYFEALGGSLLGLPRASVVHLLPELPDVRPRHARLTPCYYGSRFDNPEVSRAYAENAWKSGITWTYGKKDNHVVRHLADRGLKTFWSVNWHAWHVPTSESRTYVKETPQIQALGFDGKRKENTLCPTWFLSADPKAREIQKQLETYLLSVVNKGNYFGANWDLEQPIINPPTFCVCERCLATFRRLAKLPETTKLTPETIIADYRDAWTNFRCRQNAEMAGRLKAIFRKADHPVEFSMYSGYQGTYTKEHYGVDWALLAPHLDFAIAGYGGGRSQIYDTVNALDGVPFMGGEMWYLSDRVEDRPTPNPHTWRNRVLRQFVESGCHGCLFWWLPPMDGAAFLGTGQAAKIIAENEETMQAKNRCDDRIQVKGLPANGYAAFHNGNGQILVLLMSFAQKELPITVTGGNHQRQLQLPPYGTKVLLLKAD